MGTSCDQGHVAGAYSAGSQVSVDADRSAGDPGEEAGAAGESLDEVQDEGVVLEGVAS